MEWSTDVEERRKYLVLRGNGDKGRTAIGALAVSYWDDWS